MPRRWRSSFSFRSQRSPSSSTSPESADEETLADLDRRCLAGAVRAEQAEAFAGRDGQIESIDGAHVAVMLVELANEKGGAGLVDGDISREFYILLLSDAPCHSVDRDSLGRTRVSGVSRCILTLSLRCVARPVGAVAQSPRPARSPASCATRRDYASARSRSASLASTAARAARRERRSGRFHIAAIAVGAIELSARRVGFAPETYDRHGGRRRDAACRFHHEPHRCTRSPKPCRRRSDARKDGPVQSPESARCRRVRHARRNREASAGLDQRVASLSARRGRDAENGRRAAARAHAALCRLEMQATCVVQLYVDGHPYPNGNVDDFSPALIEGVEVYRSASEIPPTSARATRRAGSSRSGRATRNRRAETVAPSVSETFRTDSAPTGSRGAGDVDAKR